MKKAILGISCGYHDSAAALVTFSGRVIYASSEERFTRIKGDSSFPNNSIQLAIATAKAQDFTIEKICLHENLFQRKIGIRDAKGFNNKLTAAVLWSKNLVLDLQEIEKTQNLLGLKLNDIFVSNHHLSHVYGSVFSGKIRNGLAIAIDAIGEYSSGLAAKIIDFKVDQKLEFPIDRSLGLVYSAVTVFCGFKVLTGEYKLMGLAPYGRPVYKEALEKVFFDESFNLTIADIDVTNKRLYSLKLEKELGFSPRKDTDECIEQKYADLAASMQLFLEEYVIKMIERLVEKFDFYSSFDLALGGGVALNCKLTYEVANHFKHRIRNIAIIGAAGDAGSSVGACINYLINVCDIKDLAGMDDLFLGESITEQRQTANSYGLEFSILSESSIGKLVHLINNSGVVGIARGKAEFGPRALGNRSIIADPMNPKVLSFINERIKNREDFRPLAPIVLEEKVDDYFYCLDSCRDLYRSMLCLTSSKNFDPALLDNGIVNANSPICPKASSDSLLPAVVHHDGTARIQVYTRKDNDVLSELLLAKEGSVLVNTSLNIRGEPIVNNAKDAIECFLSTELDAIVLEDIVIFRDEQDPLALLNYERRTFDLD